MDFTAHATKEMDPERLVQHLEDTGWKQIPRKQSDIKVFQKEKDKFYQVTVPMDKNLSDYKEAMCQAIKTIAEAEGRIFS